MPKENQGGREKDERSDDDHKVTFNPWALWPTPQINLCENV